MIISHLFYGIISRCIPLVQVRILVKGRVQGVGFRWSVAELARKLGLEGLVRNLRDGRVEIFCDGDTNSVKQLIGEIRSNNVGFEGWGVRVEHVEYITEGQPGFTPAWRDYSGFEVDFGWD